MSGSLRVCLVQDGLLGFTKEVRAGSKRYLCFTKYAEEGGKKLLAICLSDGIGVWRVKQTEEELKELGASGYSGGDLSKVINDLSKGLQDGPLELTKLRDTIKLTVTCDGKTLDFDLLEMPATVCREESQLLLFSVWDSLEATKAKLTQAEARGKSNVFSYGGSEGQADKEQGGASEVVATSRPKKIKGASLFNPNTKRRKAATGVVFDKGDN